MHPVGSVSVLARPDLHEPVIQEFQVIEETVGPEVVDPLFSGHRRQERPVAGHRLDPLFPPLLLPGRLAALLDHPCPRISGRHDPVAAVEFRRGGAGLPEDRKRLGRRRVLIALA